MRQSITPLAAIAALLVATGVGPAAATEDTNDPPAASVIDATEAPSAARPIDWAVEFDNCALHSRKAQRINACRRRVMLHSRIDDAFANGEDGVILRLDADDDNDTPPQEAAKARYHKALVDCAVVSKRAQRIADCRRQARRDYSRSLGR